MIWSLLVGALIGSLAGGITKKKDSMGWIATIGSGLIGSSVGQGLFGSWGPSLAGMAILPSVLGSVIVVSLASMIMGRKG
ncbi:GlsB/YeaQ/YmgE family stress response membrane protein [Streptococcus fryi]